MAKQEGELNKIEIILDDSGTYRRLMPIQLKYVPVKGDYYGEFSSKKVYEIKAVIHEDIRIILLVTETDPRFSEIISIVYS